MLLKSLEVTNESLVMTYFGSTDLINFQIISINVK